jgi:hypothetical protein
MNVCVGVRQRLEPHRQSKAWVCGISDALCGNSGLTQVLAGQAEGKTWNSSDGVVEADPRAKLVEAEARTLVAGCGEW